MTFMNPGALKLLRLVKNTSLLCFFPNSNTISHRTPIKVDDIVFSFSLEDAYDTKMYRILFRDEIGLALASCFDVVEE